MEATAAPTRVASWNIGEKGLAALAAATPGGLGALFEGQLSRPDIVCLQETKLSGPDKLTSELANVPGYTSYFAFCRAATGGSLVRASSPARRHTCGTACPRSARFELNMML